MLEDIRHYHFKRLDSTNLEAFRQADAGCISPLWITAEEQTAGRGRSGRRWVSEPGNLFASLLLPLPQFPKFQFPLSLLSGIVLYDALLDLAGRLHKQGKFDTAAFQQDLRLKWPNDLLYRQQKLAGILVESRQISRDGNGAGGVAMVIGVGINIRSHPSQTSQPASHLLACGIDSNWQTVFASLRQQMAIWLCRWGIFLDKDRGRFGRTDRCWTAEMLRRAWLDRAFPPGTPITVHGPDNQLLFGRFATIDHSGALVLHLEDGHERIVHAGGAALPFA